MGRWQPDARVRLQEAALALYGERGYEETTVAEIAERAGLTKRTFFRYFADKREVLFYGGQVLQETIVDAVAAAPAEAAPIEAAQAGIEAAATMMRDWHPHSRQRSSVVGAHPELRERELIKMAAIATAIAAKLRERGAGELAAGLAGQAAVAVFHVSFSRWVGNEEPEDFVGLVKASFEELRAVTAGGSGGTDR
jgi:AcrR family transcriptional regulator